MIHLYDQATIIIESNQIKSKQKVKFFIFQTFLWMVLGSTSVTTMSLMRVNTSISFGCTNTDASIPAGHQSLGGMSAFLCTHFSLLWTVGHTLDSDVCNAMSIITHLHMETVQHSKQLEAKHTTIFASFRHCTKSRNPGQWPSAWEILTYLGAAGSCLHWPVGPWPGFSICLLGSRLRAAGSCWGMALFRKLTVDRRALVWRRKSREENSTLKTSRCETPWTSASQLSQQISVWLLVYSSDLNVSELLEDKHYQPSTTHLQHLLGVVKQSLEAGTSGVGLQDSRHTNMLWWNLFQGSCVSVCYSWRTILLTHHSTTLTCHIISPSPSL